MRNVLLVFLLLIFCENEFKRSCVFSFPSITIPGESQTKSHYLLNFYGVYLSTHDFLIEHNLVNDKGTVTDTINEFFGIGKNKILSLSLSLSLSPQPFWYHEIIFMSNFSTVISFIEKNIDTNVWTRVPFHDCYNMHFYLATMYKLNIEFHKYSLFL